jgi:hypothetical protein
MLLDHMTHASFRPPMQKRKTLRLNAAVAAFSAPFSLFREEIDRTVDPYERGLGELMDWLRAEEAADAFS